MLAAALALGCRRSPSLPALPDGVGDSTPGAVIAAREGEGFRLYRVIVALELPPPTGTFLHLTIYDEKGATLDDAAALAREPAKLHSVVADFPMQAALLRGREHRVVGFAPLTEQDLAAFRANQHIRP